MKFTLTLVMFVSLPICGQVKSSFDMVERKPETPAPYAVSPAILGAGKYVIQNAHSGLALGDQSIGRRRFVAQLDVAVDTWEFVSRGEGRYQIRGSGGCLEELAGENNLVAISDKASEWQISIIDGGDTFEIRGPSARVLENFGWRALSGNWAVMAERTGGMNQEWTIRPRSTVMTEASRPQMHVRGPRGSRITVKTSLIRSSPHASWKSDGDGFVYRYKLNEPELTKLWVDRTSEYDFAEVSTPKGWLFSGTGWFAPDGAGVNGEFALRSSWMPGPVLVAAIGEGGADVFRYDPNTTTHTQHLAAVNAQLNQGSHFWAIGPAIPPETTAKELRDLIRRWVSNGLVFVAPLLDAPSLPEAIESLNPVSAFENDLVASIRAAAEKAR